MYKCILRDLDPEVFDSHVQICTYPGLNMVQEGQPILRDQWSRWDAESIAKLQGNKKFNLVTVQCQTVKPIIKWKK